MGKITNIAQSYIIRAIVALGLVVVTALPAISLASTYGSGIYHACTYGQGCPQTSDSSSSNPNAPSDATPANILLNDFNEYFTDAGKTLTVVVGQVINFNVTKNGVTEQHTITILEINGDNVLVAISGIADPVRFTIGQALGFDVTGDGQNDIQITLGSINGTTADMNFRALSPATKTVPNQAKTPAAKTSLGRMLWLIISIAAIVIGLFIFWLLWRRRRRKDDQPTTNLPT